jgi:hypothetical protein
MYVDESGTHEQSKALIVAGYIGPSREWKSCESHFRRADRRSGIPFHAVDCAQGGKEFRGMDKDKRYRIYKKMVKIVNEHDIFGIGWGGYIEDYQKIIPREANQTWREWLGKLYVLCFQGVMLEACKYVKRNYPGEKFSAVVEDSHWYPLVSAKFLRMKYDITWPDRVLLETIAPYSSTEAPQLYAADLLAYETYLLKTRERYPTAHGMREHMIALLQKRKDGRMLSRRPMLTIHAMALSGIAQSDAAYGPPRKYKNATAT